MKSLPGKPDLEFLKKQAKALRNRHRQGDASCCALLREYDTSYRAKSDDEILADKFSINDAQRIIAREYGYTSWATLKKYIESFNLPLYNAVSDKQAYYEGVICSYDERSPRYDNHVWAREWSIQTVDFCPPKAGENVLDIACGTGFIAFYIADMVGPKGRITGVDKSTGMITRCNEKLRQSGYSHLQFIQGDAEQLDLPNNSFDRIYCNAGLYLLINPQAALRHWYELLKPGGWIGFTVWPDNSFVWGDGVRQALRKQGINSTVHEFAGTREKARALAELAGFDNIELHEVKRGRWMKPEDLKGPITQGIYSPGQYPDPLAGVLEETLLRAQQDYEAEVDRLTTDKGVWHDMTTYYVYARKNNNRDE